MSSKNNENISPDEIEKYLKNVESWSDPKAVDLLKLLHRRVNGESEPGPWAAIELRLYGNPKKYIENNDEWGPGFGASVMDGADLKTFAGLSFNSDEDHDAISNGPDWQEILDTIMYDSMSYETRNEPYHGVEYFEIGEQDDMCGMSDTYFWISIGDDPHKIAQKLRELLVSYIGNDTGK